MVHCVAYITMIEFLPLRNCKIVWIHLMDTYALFINQRESAIADPKGSNCFYLYPIWFSETCFDIFVSVAIIGLFWTSKMFYSPKESSLKNYPRGPIGRVAIITLTYPPKESSLEPLRGVPLSPKGEFSLRGVPLVEWLSLPYIIGIFFLPPYEPSKNFLLLDGRAGGRADGRTGRIYLFHFFLGKTLSYFFSFFFKCL